MSDQRRPRGSDGAAAGIGGWGVWTGIVAVAAVIVLGVFLLAPGGDDSNKTPSTRVEGTTPAPNVTPKPNSQ